ncbi:MAG: hypothetical protein H6636_03280 [Anaerolineales bacterium]|nr:hypothetical protein [Anaerolineales bacterium]
MNPKIIVIIVVTYWYGLFEGSMNLKQRGKGKATRQRDRGAVVWRAERDAQSQRHPHIETVLRL